MNKKTHIKRKVKNAIKLLTFILIFSCASNNKYQKLGNRMFLTKYPYEKAYLNFKEDLKDFHFTTDSIKRYKRHFDVYFSDSDNNKYHVKVISGKGETIFYQNAFFSIDNMSLLNYENFMCRFTECPLE